MYKSIILTILFSGCLFAAHPTESAAQQAGLFADHIPIENNKELSRDNDSRPKVALTLSGGGAKGFAHIGALKVLEEVGMPIDFITGTSMGALIGGLYSIGYGTEFIESMADTLSWTDLFSDEIRRRHMPMEEKEWDGLYLVTLPIMDWSINLPSGVVAGQRIGKLLTDLTWPYPGHQNFLEFPIPFKAVATNIVDGEIVVMSEGYLADAIRASISIPSVFMPITVNGDKLVDGGVVRNLPVEEAFEMGADIVIAVNVADRLRDADELRTIFDILDQTVSFQIYKSVQTSADLADITITPDISDYGVNSFDKVRELIDLGEKTAREHYDELKELAESLNTTAKEVTVPEIPDEVLIKDIKVINAEHSSDTQIKNKMMVRPGDRVTREYLGDGIERIYGMQFFERVTYRLVSEDDDDEGYLLEIDVYEREQDVFRFGFNYDNYNKASILLNTTFRNLFNPSSIIRLHLKLGEEPYFDAIYFNYLTLSSDIALRLRANYSLSNIDIFSPDGDRLSTFSTDTFFIESHFLPVTTNQVYAGIGLRKELFHVTRSIGELDFPGGFSSITSGSAIFRFDNKNRKNFTKRGHRVDLEATHTINLFDNSLNFFQTEAEWQGFFQLHDKWVLQSGIHAGFATSSDLPLHKQFYLGGYPDFSGYRPYEIASSNIRAGHLGLQFEFMSNNFFEIRGNSVNTEEFYVFDLTPENTLIGWSFTYGINSMIGPARISYMGSPRNPVMITYSLGVRF